MSPQVISRERVTAHGEVLTAQREVEAMVNLVDQEASNIESRFLEPACGNGNFLVEILKRKLAVVERRHGKPDAQHLYERNSVIAVTSLYGIDLLEDNVLQCRNRLLANYEDQYRRLFNAAAKDECLRCVKFILERNIIWGDALTLMTVGEKRHIVFSEWSPVNGTLLKRRDFTFRALLAHEDSKSLPLFSDQGESVFIPTPEKEFPAVRFMELPDVQ